MNFFEHQESAKTRTRWLLLLFGIALILIILLFDLVLLVLFGQSPAGVTDLDYISRNSGILIAGAVGTALLIVLASLFRMSTLASGGGKVAQELGGTLVDADVKDFKRRQLRNVVEEMAIAAGIPVPEIYVLEREAGINAFAAGLSTSDAAIAVTRGLLESMNREELQGVIAHEFSHILNGDMRLNLRLVGVIFGILILSIIGRKILHSTSRSRNGKNDAGAILIGLSVMLIGYVGLFFGRWIKASVSRQREFLADASAVQYTRNPESISGALKKIAVHARGSFMDEDTEEIGHMLFGQGMTERIFASHPPILERIRRIQPGFREEELEDVRRRLERQLHSPSAEEPARAHVKSGDNLFGVIGNPDLGRLLQAALLMSSIPEEVMDAARSVEWAPAVLLYILLDGNSVLRLKQQEIISRECGLATASNLEYLVSNYPVVDIQHRMPLFELVFPALKRRPSDQLAMLVNTIGQLIRVDNKIDTFEYLLVRMIGQHLSEAEKPGSVRLHGNRTLAETAPHVVNAIAILSQHGHPETERAEKAFLESLEIVGLPAVSYSPPDDWMETLDRALPVLNLLKPSEKKLLIHAFVKCVMFDERVVPKELELLRVLSAALHVPLPPLQQSDANH